MREHIDRTGNQDKTDYYDTHRVGHECTVDIMDVQGEITSNHDGTG